MQLAHAPTTVSRFTPEQVQQRRGEPLRPILTDDAGLCKLGAVYFGTSLNDFASQLPAIQAGLPPDGVLLCLNSDELAAQLVLLLEAEKIRFLPGGEARPVADYWRTNDVARDTLHALWAEDGMNFRSEFELADYQNLMQMITETRDIPGDYVEVGVSWGSSARIALHYMRALGLHRRCFFLDTFDGFNYPAASTSSDHYWKGDGAAWGTEARAREILLPYSGNGLAVQVLRRNIIDDPLPGGITQIALANIDVDMLGAVRAAMAKIHPLMAAGGVMIMEDAGHTPLLYGARAAVNEFAATYGHLYTKLYLSSGQAVFMRRPEKA